MDNTILVFKVGMFQTLMLSILAIYFGEFMRNKFQFFKKYCIPAPVIGGTIFAIIITIAYSCRIASFDFDFKTINTFFYNVFFAAMGLAASLKLLKQGGKLVLIFSILAAALAFLQNVLAIGVGMLFDMNPLVALMAGSIPLTGGHGNAGSFGPIAEGMGAVGSLEVAIAAATFGLVAGCIIGGPMGRRIIQKNGLQVESKGIMDRSIKESVSYFVDQKRSHQAAFMLLLACGIGQTFYVLFKKLFPSIDIPIHVMSMFGGIIVRLILDKVEPKNADALHSDISIIGEISLALFVSMSICTMKIWQLYSLAIPLITILMLQVVLCYLFCVFITFRACGKNYDAAIISVGHSGFGLGAVPVSMATMDAVCSKYGYSKIAFFVVPLIGGFISNITNASIITIFMNIAKKLM